jgi:hypothetical protein
MEAAERITEILNGTLAPDPTVAAELEAYEARHSAVVRGWDCAGAQRNAAMIAISRFSAEAGLAYPEKAREFQAIADRLTTEAQEEFERYCAEHPYPPEPAFD